MAARAVLAILLGALLAACGGEEQAAERAPEHKRHCAAATFTPPSQSPYVLPWTVNTAHIMFQGNCPDDPRWGHNSMLAYDFDLPIGTPVLAARAGTVSWVNEQYVDFDLTPGHENNVHITHADGTVARYGHLTHQGALVVVGQVVAQGEVIALSGHTGNSGTPHLHFDVMRPNSQFAKSDTLPVTFRNAGGEMAANGELLLNRAYLALP